MSVIVPRLALKSMMKVPAPAAWRSSSAWRNDPDPGPVVSWLVVTVNVDSADVVTVVVAVAELLPGLGSAVAED